MFDIPNTTLANARIGAELTVEDMIDYLGVHHMTYRNWEHGLGCPDQKAWNLIRDRLGTAALDNFRIKPERDADTREHWRDYLRLCELNVYSPTPETLCEARARIGVSQARMAQIFNVSGLTWNKWENGHTAPRPPLYELMERCFGPVTLPTLREREQQAQTQADNGY